MKTHDPPSRPSHLQLSGLASEICVCWIILLGDTSQSPVLMFVEAENCQFIWGVCDCSVIRRQRLANLTWFCWMNSRRLFSKWQKTTQPGNPSSFLTQYICTWWVFPELPRNMSLGVIWELFEQSNNENIFLEEHPLIFNFWVGNGTGDCPN